MSKKTITARNVLQDIRLGLNDAQIMEKYKLSARGLYSLFSKLVEAGMITQSDLDKRSPATERTVELGFYVCSACGNIESAEFSTCPKCGHTREPTLKNAVLRNPKSKKTPQRTAAKQESPEPKQPDAPAPLRARPIPVKLDSEPPEPREAPEAPQPADVGPEPPAAESLNAPPAPVLGKLDQIVRHGRLLAIGAMASYVVIAALVLAAIGFPPREGVWSSVYSLFAAFAMQLPVIAMVVALFIAVRALAESAAIIARSSAPAPGKQGVAKDDDSSE